LDEPTHHLDLAGKEVLEEALEQYPGAVIVVTHDRSLMARLATRILAVNDGRVTLYPGGYDDYEAARLAEESGRGRSAETRRGGTGPPAASAVATNGREGARAGKDAERRAKNKALLHAKEIERLEREIEMREGDLKTVEADLADPAVYTDRTRTKELLARYQGLRGEVDSLWRRLAELLPPPADT
jgi:ATP-binding cassette subfamily F protein 3